MPVSPGPDRDLSSGYSNGDGTVTVSDADRARGLFLDVLSRI